MLGSAACLSQAATTRAGQAHLCVIEHDDAAHETKHVLQAWEVFQILTLLETAAVAAAAQATTAQETPV
jgi:hypothetical protein